MAQSVLDIVIRSVQQEGVLTDGEFVYLSQLAVREGWINAHEARAMAGLDGLTNKTSAHHTAPKKVACSYCARPNDMEANECERCGGPMPITEG